MIYYTGGVKLQNGKRYLTAETPAASEDSTVVATTAWVQDKIDAVESAVSGGMFPTIQTAIKSGSNTVVPAGGTWWVLGIESVANNQSFPGGYVLSTYGGLDESLFCCIKIA